MKQIFYYSCISEARKFELSEILERVESIVIAHHPETLGINGMFQLLQAEKTGLSKLTAVESRSYPEKDKVSQLYIRRNQLLYAIKNQSTAVLKAAVASQTSHAALVIPVNKRRFFGCNKFRLADEMKILRPGSRITRKHRIFSEYCINLSVCLPLTALNITSSSDRDVACPTLSIKDIY